MSIGKGKFHLIFSSFKNFMKAMAISYLGEKKKRCHGLVSEIDQVLIVQPSVSTPGLNVLILKTTNIDEEKIRKLIELFEKEEINLIECDSLRRPSEAQGFTLWFEEADKFINALNLFYPRRGRCRAIIPKKEGPLLIEPAVSTIELNTLLLENYNLIVGKEKSLIQKEISDLDQFECESIQGIQKTTNFIN